MSTAWLTVLLTGGVTMATKALGPILLGGRRSPRRATRAPDLLAPAMLGGLIVVTTFGHGQDLRLDARAVGLLIAVIGAAMRWHPAVIAIGAIAAVALAHRYVA